MNSTLELLQLLRQRNGGKIIAASLGKDKQHHLSKKISYLKKKKYVEKKDGLWEITDEGKEYYSKKNKFKKFDSPFSRISKKEYLVIFDVSESERSKRNYIREQLKEFGYVLIQRSVWYGPGPLPKGFMKYLKELNLKDNVMVFKTNQKLL